MTDHPLTETAAAEVTEEMVAVAIRTWFGTDTGVQEFDMRAALSAALAVATPADPRHDPRPWQDCTVGDIRKGDLVEARTDDRLAVGVAHHQDGDGDWWTEDDWLVAYGDRWPLRRIPAPEKDTPMTETTPAIVPSEPLARTLLAVPDTHGAPHHDVDQIKAGDFVAEVDKDGTICSGFAHHQDEDGDWRTEVYVYITWAEHRADHPEAVTVWPAPTPPAEEVELPTEFGAVITDVGYGVEGRVDRLVNAGQDWWVEEAGHFWYPTDFDAFTLPDGTRARLDGEHEDGSPRFVKEDNQ